MSSIISWPSGCAVRIVQRVAERCASSVLVFMVVALSLGASSPLAAQIAVSNFDTDLDGWTLDSVVGWPPGEQGDGENLRWVSTGGHGSPGYIEADDASGGPQWRFCAPAKFLGDVSSAYLQTLTFCLQQAPELEDQNEQIEDVFLEGAGLLLVFDTGVNPVLAPAWSSYSIDLDETAGWKIDTFDGSTPSSDQMQAVLGDLTRLCIRGEYEDGSDTDGLDSVVLNDGSVPSLGWKQMLLLTVLLLALGSLVLRHRSSART